MGRGRNAVTAPRKARPRLVPYWQPPENPVADARASLVRIMQHEIEQAQDTLTPHQLALRLLTRLDLLGLAPGSQRTAAPQPMRRSGRAICPTHLEQLAGGRCRGCAADSKATPDPS